MSIHKLTAGSGYEYLTRQVAAHDGPGTGRAGLASYYTERGETPGRWVGAGMAGIDGLSVGDEVTAQQMLALFGSGHHPLAAQRQATLAGPDLTPGDHQAVARLGQPYPVYEGDVSSFRAKVAVRIGQYNRDLGMPADWPVSADERARIGTQVATEMFRADNGRDPLDARELAGTIARASRQRTTAVSGYDLTFSPVKSVSALWAIADRDVAAQIERAHHQAVADALAFIEQRALFTRVGSGGIRQVDVRGLVAAAFTHRDSRAGDPDLHTHVALANKVQTLDGRWLSIDGRVLFKANVSASETYNAALERHLSDRLGLRFTERPNPDPRKRPTREVVGVEPALNARWSARRAAVEARRDQLAAQFQGAHGRPPTPVEAIKLAQQATLETRQGKHEPRTLAEQRAAWADQAQQVLGGPGGVHAMVTAALHPSRAAAPQVTRAWVNHTAEQVARTVAEHRATWQDWHVRAEAIRAVRAAHVPTARADATVDRVVQAVLTRHSMPVAAGIVDEDRGIREPAALRRSGGTSTYHVAGSRLYTSAAILAAERRLVDAAGLTGGRAASAVAVDLALLEQAANGVTLNAGQASMVRAMATSGTRLQLAIAPAGSGKTTTMRALTRAWTEDGGTVVGLAPSAAAAEVLHSQIDTHADTLAKLTWALARGCDLPGWAEQVGPDTLLIIDEAGMADTLTLDAAVTFALQRGASIRLVGDDQQLSAIGAGGVLRDIKTSHGALHLAELVRFTDPAEAAASLALRDGRAEALGYYLDHQRVHVGSLATLTDDLFDAWAADRGRGLDALMLAPTRDLVADLNRRARDHRLTGHPDTDIDVGPRPAGKTTPPDTSLPDLSTLLRVVLTDGNHASAGDTVITRTNNRQLRLSPTDWVKNGDRWTVLDVNPDGRLHVAHARTGRTLTLPAWYVAESVELGYATTIHAAQGVSADTMHGLLSGEETRQQLYTMLTRGRIANHAYVQVVGDGDPHQVIYPTVLHPATPTDILERILARDGAATSATTAVRDHHDPALRLGPAATRYVDALSAAAEEHAGPAGVAALNTAADRIWPDLTQTAAWPALRAHLLLLGAAGTDPVTALRAAAGSRELDTADDPAAVLDWRLDDTGHRNTHPGPLPWLFGIPASLGVHPRWGDYLSRRADLVADLAHTVHDTAIRDATDGTVPPWAPVGVTIDPDLAGDITVWRAATGVPADDTRPLGRPQLQKAAVTHQQHLRTRLGVGRTPALTEWATTLARLEPAVSRDPFLPTLAEHLAAMARAGVPAHTHLQQVAQNRPLPDDHAAAALWWRLAARLPATLRDTLETGQPVAAAWLPALRATIGADHVAAFEKSRWWPSYVAAMDHAHARGWTTPDLLDITRHATTAADEANGIGEDPVLAAVWRLSVLADPQPLDLQTAADRDMDFEPVVPDPTGDPAPHDLHHGDTLDPRSPETTHPEPAPDTTSRPDRPAVAHPHHRAAGPEQDLPAGLDELEIDDALAAQASIRDNLDLPDLTDAEIDTLLTRAYDLDSSPVPEARMIAVNQLALDFYRAHLPGSWTARYLTDRLGPTVLTDPRFAPGHAPNAWTALVDHLHGLGVTNQEILAVDLARRSTVTGRLVDRFRDRAVLPITHDRRLVGFVARRHPDRTDDAKAGPKYLNTGQTALFHKGSRLYGADHLTPDATPVLVEGPLDAIAVTLAGHGTHIGVAPLGTALTHEQARQLAAHGIDPIVATDNDIAGQVAAERDYWTLTPWLLDPRHARFPTGTDPAELSQLRGPAALLAALTAATPLADTLADERRLNLPVDRALEQVTLIQAARPSAQWTTFARDLTSAGKVANAARAKAEFLDAVRAWNRDARGSAAPGLNQLQQVRARLLSAADLTPAQRWSPLAERLYPGLSSQPGWIATADMIQLAHDQGHDVRSLITASIAQRCGTLGDNPNSALRYSLVAHIDIPQHPHQPPAGEASSAGDNYHLLDDQHPQTLRRDSSPRGRER